MLSKQNKIIDTITVSVHRYLFWIDWVGTLYSPSASIERYDVTRGRHDVIFNITKDIMPNMGRPIGLATDHPNKRLYWVDAKYVT